MPINEQQLQERVNRIGGSDVSEILFRNAHNVYLEKTRKVPVDVVRQNEAMELGNLLEPMLIDFCRAKVEDEFETDVEVSHPELPIVTILDGLRQKYPEPADAKTSGLTGGNTRFRQNDEGFYEGWGEPETGQVPDRVTCQLLAQMACCRAQFKVDVEVGYVPALIAGRGRVMYFVRFDGDVWEWMAGELHHFWFHHVQRDIPPENTVPTWEYARLLHREQGTKCVVPASLIRAVESNRQQSAAVNKEWKKVLRPKAAIYGAEYLVPDDGSDGCVHVTEPKKERTWIKAHYRDNHAKVLYTKKAPKKVAALPDVGQVQVEAPAEALPEPEGKVKDE